MSSGLRVQIGFVLFSSSSWCKRTNSKLIHIPISLLFYHNWGCRLNCLQPTFLHRRKMQETVYIYFMEHYLLKHNQNYKIKIRSHRSRNPRKPCHQLVSSDGDRQRARAFYQMDQRGHTHPKGRTTGHEPWWGQLPTEPRIRPLSWHGVFPLCQEPEELSTSFFWWRPLIEVETSSCWVIILVVFE